MAHIPWSDAENDLIVADYFAMLTADLAEHPYIKKEHNRALRDRVHRSPGSIEYKHRNISAVLKGLGESWIPGYRPAFNFQMSLAHAVVRWLDRNPQYLTHPALTERTVGVREGAVLPIGPPPTLSNEPPPDELRQMLEIARTFDAAHRAERNQVLGRAGEERALSHERTTLMEAGRYDLAERVRWVSKDEGDGAGYDIASFSTEGRNRLIEVKTTNGWERTPFHITRNELAVAEQHPAE